METVKDWENHVNKITSRIHSEYPELIKFIEEMPDIKNGDSNIGAIKNYYLSLEQLVAEYAKTH